MKRCNTYYRLFSLPWEGGDSFRSVILITTTHSKRRQSTPHQRSVGGGVLFSAASSGFLCSTHRMLVRSKTVVTCSRVLIQIDDLGRIHRVIQFVAEAGVHKERPAYLLFSVGAVNVTEDVNARLNLLHALQQ